MLQASTLRFLKSLKKNNNKPWFEKNKDAYLGAREDIDQFVQQVIDGLGKTDANLALLKPKDCTFRIYRDVRFSKNKTPYKSNMGAYFNRGGKKANTAGFIFIANREATGWAAACGCLNRPSWPRSARRSIIISMNGKRSSAARRSVNSFPMAWTVSKP